MGAVTMIHVRLDGQVKEEASAALESMGFLFLMPCARCWCGWRLKKVLPFALRVPNATTRAAMAEADEMVRAGQARFATGADLIKSLT